MIAVILSIALGLIARLLGPPPLVGSLAADFALEARGLSRGEVLETIANLGVYLLLFGTGLNLDLRGLLRPQTRHAS